MMTLPTTPAKTRRMSAHPESGENVRFWRSVLAQGRRNRTIEGAGEVRVFEASSVVGEASLGAYRDAQSWLVSQAR
jgi:hypothetical protein